MAKKTETYYIVTYKEPDTQKTVEIKAKSISDSVLGLGFVSISDFIFSTSGVVVQPSEEQQRSKFEGVKSFHLNIYSILSIKEMGLKNKGLQFKNDKSKVLTFPESTPLS
jgi:hypothetical protein